MFTLTILFLQQILFVIFTLTKLNIFFTANLGRFLDGLPSVSENMHGAYRVRCCGDLR